jgi:hypothetical protein
MGVYNLLIGKREAESRQQIKFNASVRANGIAKTLHTRHEKTFGSFPSLLLSKIMKQKWYLELLFYLLPISLVFILGDKMNLVYFFLIITPSAVFYWLYLDLEKQ